MEREPIFQVIVDLKRDEISELTGKNGSVKMLPFTGTVKGKLFSGVIAPGGVDTQITNRLKTRSMSARYMLIGEDFTGKPCRIFVENNGCYSNGELPKPFHTIPTFYTDSEALAPILMQNCYIGEGLTTDGVLTISFYKDED